MIDTYNIYRLNNKQILAELGKSLQRKRINFHLTQKDLSEKAGISQYTVVGMEKGRSVSLDTFITVLRQMEHLDLLYHLFLKPEPIAPDVLLKLEKKKKRRVRKTKNKPE